jgi:hypothetical protein
MKPLYLLLFLTALVEPAHGDSFRFLHFIVNAEKPDVLYPALKSPAGLGAVVDGDKIILKEQAEGNAHFDQTHPIEYAQSYDDDGTPREITSRRVGLSIKAHQNLNGTISLNITSTALDQWIFCGENSKMLQPVFNEKQINTTFSLVSDSPLITGSLAKTTQRNGGEMTKQWSVFVIQKILTLNVR